MSSRRYRTRQRGQVLMMFAITFSLFLFGMLVIVANLSELYVQQSFVVTTAQFAARSAASEVDVPYYQSSGVAALDVANALSACQDAVIQEVASTHFVNGDYVLSPTCTLYPLSSAHPDEMVTTVSERVFLPFPFMTASVTVGSSSSAYVVIGATSPIAT